MRAGPGIPGLGGERVAVGADAQQVDHHKFRVTVPAEFDVAMLGSPALGEGELVGASAFEEPRPVHAVVDGGYELRDFRVGEVGSAGEGAAEENGSINVGDFA